MMVFLFSNREKKKKNGLFSQIMDAYWDSKIADLGQLINSILLVTVNSSYSIDNITQLNI